MARPRTQSLPTTKIPPLPVDASGNMKLDPAAQSLFDEISSQWDLTPAITQQLRIVCEKLTVARICDATVAVEGCAITDLKGSQKSHPLLAQSVTLKVAAGNLLTKIHGALQD